MPESEFNDNTFQQYLDGHRLMGSRCQSCEALHLPPRPLCPECYSQDLAWEELAGMGKLEAFTSVYVAPSAMIAAGYGRDNPYCVGVVRLDDGPSISAQLMDVDPTQPDQIKIGQSLEASFLDRDEGEGRKTFLVFKKK
jgi:uncharacterized OB-fold protein